MRAFREKKREARTCHYPVGSGKGRAFPSRLWREKRRESSVLGTGAARKKRGRLACVAAKRKKKPLRDSSFSRKGKKRRAAVQSMER